MVGMAMMGMAMVSEAIDGHVAACRSWKRSGALTRTLTPNLPQLEAKQCVGREVGQVPGRGTSRYIRRYICLTALPLMTVVRGAGEGVRGGRGAVEGLVWG